MSCQAKRASSSSGPKPSKLNEVSLPFPWQPSMTSGLPGLHLGALPHMLPWVIPDSSTPLLLTTAGPVGKAILASTLRAMFHRAAEAAGLSNKNYTPPPIAWGCFFLLSGRHTRGTNKETQHLDIPHSRPIPVPAPCIPDS